MGRTTAETTFVVDLSVLSYSNGLPQMNQKLSRILGATLSKGLTGRIMGNHIQAIKTSHFLTSWQIVRHDVHLAQLMRLARLQVRIVEFTFG